MLGLFYAISSRQFFIFPISAVGTGCSFGFFMGIGMILRTQMEGYEEDCDNDKNAGYQIIFVKQDPETGKLQITKEPIYQKYIV